LNLPNIAKVAATVEPNVLPPRSALALLGGVGGDVLASEFEDVIKLGFPQSLRKYKNGVKPNTKIRALLEGPSIDRPAGTSAPSLLPYCCCGRQTNTRKNTTQLPVA
jgi:hypothetical protein